MEYKYLLFDLDGTLTDPKEGITTSVQYALRAFGIEEPDLEKLKPFIGPPLQSSFMDFYGFDEEKAKGQWRNTGNGSGRKAFTKMPFIRGLRKCCQG